MQGNSVLLQHEKQGKGGRERDCEETKAGDGAQRAFYTVLRIMHFFPVSSAKPLQSLKNSSDIVLKHKITLAAVSSGVFRGVFRELAIQTREGNFYNSSCRK